jgi:C-terminal peptidase prc
MKRVFLTGLLALVCVAVSQIQAAPKPKVDAKAYVVLIGIDRYQDPQILPRRHAESDVKALFDLLTSRPNQGLYSREQIRLLLGSADEKRGAEKATRENILKALDWAFGEAKEADTILIVWLGQGAPSGSATCYFAADSTVEGRAKDAVASGEIQARFSKRRTENVGLLLDVNFRGYNPELKLSEFSLEKRFQEFSSAGEEREEEAGPGGKRFVLLSATNGMQPSAELADRSLFMSLILDGLGGAADKYGEEADGVVTIDEIVEYVAKEYAARAKALVKKDQIVFARGRSTHFVVATNPTVAEQVAQQLKQFEDLAGKEGFAPEIIKEGTELLSQMPRLESQRELRKKLKALLRGSLPPREFLAEWDKAKAAVKLSREDAEEFCDRIFKVARYAQEEYVKPVNLANMLVAGITGLYRFVEEKVPKDLQERLDVASTLSEGELRELLLEARMRLGRRDDLKKYKDSHLFLEFMLHSLDAHSTYIDPESLRDVERQTNQRFIGVGIRIVKDFESDFIRVSTPIRGSPAYRAGIRTGDLLTKIINYVGKDGKPLPEPVTVSCKGMSSTDAVNHIVGKKGTKVTLVMERRKADGKVETIPFDLIRDTVVVETVLGVKRNPDDSWDFYLDHANKIAYIRMTQFAENTEKELRDALTKLSRTGINGLIFDLRFNPGGFLSASVDIANMFIDDGVIVTIRPRDVTQERSYRAQPRRPKFTNFPMVILINGGSASASEIVSACLQDQERCIVMGERSFGKGSVQTMRPINLGDGPAQIKLTIASFWRPNGRNLNRFKDSKETDDWGVSPLPEHTIKLTPQELIDLREHLLDHEAIPNPDLKKDQEEPFQDRQLNAALELLRKQVAQRAVRKAG